MAENKELNMSTLILTGFYKRNMDLMLKKYAIKFQRLSGSTVRIAFI